MNDTVTAYFVGPDDASTCDTGGPDDEGCDGAVNGNPYTLDTVPEPGSFACTSRCRHMVQVHGDAPDGVETMDYTGDIGFGAAGDAANETGAERLDAAGVKLDDLTPDELAIVDMSNGEIAQYLKDNNLDISDVDSVLTSDDQDAVRAEMNALGYRPSSGDDFSAMVSNGDVDSIRAYIDANGVDEAHQLAADGFSDASDAYNLADALNQVEKLEQWEVEYDPETQTWTVTNSVQRLAQVAKEQKLSTLKQFLREVGTASSGNHHHAGRPGEVGGSGPSDSPRVIVPSSAGEGKTDHYWMGVSQPSGAPIRGTPIAWNDPRIPDIIYHVTPNADAIQASGLLRAGGVGGLGGDKNDQIVSFTISKPVAENLKSAMLIMSNVAREVGPEPPMRTPEREAWGTKTVEAFAKGAKAEGWDYKLEPNYEEAKSDYGLSDWSTQFMGRRDSAHMDKETYQTPERWRNPLFFGVTQQYWANVDPKSLGIISIPKANLNTGALITDFDLGQRNLEEVRSYGDVPITNHMRETLTAIREAAQRQLVGQVTSVRVREVGTASSGNHNHPGRPGHVGGSGPSMENVSPEAPDLALEHAKGGWSENSQARPHLQVAANRQWGNEDTANFTPMMLRRWGVSKENKYTQSDIMNLANAQERNAQIAREQYNIPNNTVFRGSGPAEYADIPSDKPFTLRPLMSTTTNEDVANRFGLGGYESGNYFNVNYPDTYRLEIRGLSPEDVFSNTKAFQIDRDVKAYGKTHYEDVEFEHVLYGNQHEWQVVGETTQPWTFDGIARTVHTKIIEPVGGGKHYDGPGSKVPAKPELTFSTADDPEDESGWGKVFTAKLGDKVVATARKDINNSYLSDVYVNRAYQRQGIGMKLYDYIEKDRGIKLTQHPTYDTPALNAFWAHRKASASREVMREGGPGSGDRGHPGRPGQVGGSGQSAGVSKAAAAVADNPKTASGGGKEIPPSDPPIDTTNTRWKSYVKKIVDTPGTHAYDLNSTGNGYQLEAQGMDYAGSSYVDPKVREYNARLKSTVLDEVAHNIDDINGQVHNLDQLFFAKSMSIGSDDFSTTVAVTLNNSPQGNVVGFNMDKIGRHQRIGADYTTADRAANTTEYAKLITDHEMGHVFYNQLGRKDTSQWKSTWQNAQINEEHFTGYSESNDREGFAEAYCAYVNGFKDRLPRGYMEFFLERNVDQLKEAEQADNEPLAILCGFGDAPTVHVYADRIETFPVKQDNEDHN